MDFEEPETMTTCSVQAMVSGAVLLEGDCLDGILALLKAKALCLLMRTCRALGARAKATTTWSALGPRTGGGKLRAWEMAVRNAIGVAC